jgi:hypothetical protein
MSFFVCSTLFLHFAVFAIHFMAPPAFTQKTNACSPLLVIDQDSLSYLGIDHGNGSGKQRHKYPR